MTRPGQATKATRLARSSSSSDHPASAERTRRATELEYERSEEEEEERALAYFDDPVALRRAMQEELRISTGEAIELGLTYGLKRCEGALLNTRVTNERGYVKRPIGWFVATLRKGKEWRPWAVRAYKQEEQERQTYEREFEKARAEGRLSQFYETHEGGGESPEEGS